MSFAAVPFVCNKSDRRNEKNKVKSVGQYQRFTILRLFEIATDKRENTVSTPANTKMAKVKSKVSVPRSCSTSSWRKMAVIEIKIR